MGLQISRYDVNRWLGKSQIIMVVQEFVKTLQKIIIIIILYHYVSLFQNIFIQFIISVIVSIRARFSCQTTHMPI